MFRKRAVVLLVPVLLVALFPSWLLAQTAEAPVPPGIRVRVTAGSAPNAAQVGVLGELEPDALVLHRSGLDPLTIPLPDVVKLEISRGEKGHWLAGTLIGTAVGIGAGLLIANATSVTDEEPRDPLTGFAAAVSEQGMDMSIVMISTVAGAGLGALVGALIKTEKWETVPIPTAPVRYDPAVVRR
jgi:hypothetical protein